MRHQVADFNPEKGSDETFTVSLLNTNGKEESARELLGCQITAKCDEDGIYWKNADKLQFRFRSCTYWVFLSGCSVIRIKFLIVVRNHIVCTGVVHE